MPTPNAKPMSAPQLEAVLAGKYGKLTGLIHRLAQTALAAVNQRELAEGELATERRSLGELERARPDREKVLVVVEADGFIEAFAESWVDVRVVHFPRVNDANRGLCEEAMEHQIPRVFHDLWMPGKVRATGNAKCCPSVIEMKYGIETREAMRFLDQVGGKAS